MRLRVQRTDGNIETITLVPSVEAALGDEHNILVDSTGTQYVFGEDGHYEGWGRKVECESMEQAQEIYEQIESSREIEGK